MSIKDAVLEVLALLKTSNLPPTINVKYAERHPHAGESAGNLVLKGEGPGRFSYVLQAHHDASTARHLATAELVRSHMVRDVQSLVKAVNTAALDNGAEHRIPVVFAAANSDGQLTVDAVLDEQHPENGSVIGLFPRHPQFARWAEFCGGLGGFVKVHGHMEFADFLMDYREELAQPMTAVAVAGLRTAKSTSYQGDDKGGPANVAVVWNDGSEGEIKVPREIVVVVRPFDGIIPDKRYNLVFRVRVVASKEKDDPSPKFRVSCVNGMDLVRQMTDDAIAELGTKLSPIPVVHGAAKSTRYATAG